MFLDKISIANEQTLKILNQKVNYTLKYIYLMFWFTNTNQFVLPYLFIL